MCDFSELWHLSDYLLENRNGFIVLAERVKISGLANFRLQMARNLFVSFPSGLIELVLQCLLKVV